MKKNIRWILALTLVLAMALGLASGAEAKTATRITMSKRVLSMDWGTKYTLSVTLTPSNASDRGSINWTKGADPSNLIQSIVPSATFRSATITVRPMGSGDVYPTEPVAITATTSTGRSATCMVTVKQVLVTSIDVRPSSKTVYFTETKPTFQMDAPVFSPSVAGDQASYTWDSTVKGVATVDGSGVVTIIGEGTTKIYAKYASGSVIKQDYMVLTVKPVRVKSIALSCEGEYAGYRYVVEDEHFALDATLASAVTGLNPSYPKVTFSSKNASIAEVDPDTGVVTAQASGITVITATADVGRYARSATCTVYVRDDSPTPLTITAGGDVVLGGDPRTSGITARAKQKVFESLISKNGAAYPFARIKKLFEGENNLSIVNVEVTLTTKGGSNPKTTRQYLFRGRPGNARVLAEAGIDVANIANNHSADFGTTSYKNTASSIKTYGGRAEPSGYNRYGNINYVPTKTVGGKVIGFYGFQANQVPLAQLSKRIRDIKNGKKLDMLVVTIHWVGQKEQRRPVTSTMKAYARRAVDAGADLVVGHHRHQTSGIEKYKGKYIVYDLGNFVTGGGDSRYTYAVQVDFAISEGFTETVKDGIRIYPLYTVSGPAKIWSTKAKKYVGQNNNWQPVPAAEAILQREADGTDVPDPNVTSRVISIINDNSPAGAEGKFDATLYIAQCPKAD